MAPETIEARTDQEKTVDGGRNEPPGKGGEKQTGGDNAPHSGEKTDNQAIYRYYGEVMSRGQLRGFDQDRLDKVLSLPYVDWLKGTAGFYGYIVLKFAHTQKVLEECPVYPNALYVLDSDDERLLKVKKRELRASGEANWIPHSGDWFQRVKRELGIE